MAKREKMKSKIFYTQLFGVLLIILIMLIAIPIYKEKIPKKLSNEIQKRLQEKGIDWVAVRVESRDITLSGVAPTIALHNQAINIAKETIGIRRVLDKISPTIITPYSMNIEYKKGEKLIFRGYMPSKESIENLYKRIESEHPQSKLIKQIDIGTGEPKSWEELIVILSLLLQDLDLATVNIVDTQISLSAKCQNSKTKEKIVEHLRNFESRGYTIQQRIVAMDESTKVCQDKFNTLLSSQKIVFDMGKSTIKSENTALLNSLVDISSLCPDAKIDIVGYTDNKGNDAKNRLLSQDRAKAVVAKLFQLGIPLEQMKAIGRGESEPVADNASPEGRAENRRIEFRVKGL